MFHQFKGQKRERVESVDEGRCSRAFREIPLDHSLLVND